jgi:hypothetical protein
MRNLPESKTNHVAICCSSDPYDGGNKWHLMKTVDAIQYYEKHIKLLQDDIAHWDSMFKKSFICSQESDRENEVVLDPTKFAVVESSKKFKKIEVPKTSGYGFVIFSLPEYAKKFLKYYEPSGIKIIQRTIEEQESKISDWLPYLMRRKKKKGKQKALISQVPDTSRHIVRR